MSAVRYCPSCGTVKPYYSASGGKPCCPDGYDLSCDKDIAEQAAVGFKADLVLNALAESDFDFRFAYAALRDLPVLQLVEMVKKWKRGGAE